MRTTATKKAKETGQSERKEDKSEGGSSRKLVALIWASAEAHLRDAPHRILILVS